jgi:hypothetical protein
VGDPDEAGAPSLVSTAAATDPVLPSTPEVVPAGWAPSITTRGEVAVGPAGIPVAAASAALPVPEVCNTTVALELPVAVAEPVVTDALPVESLLTSDSLFEMVPTGVAVWTLDVELTESLATLSLFPVSARAVPELEIWMFVLLTSTWAWALVALRNR